MRVPKKLIRLPDSETTDTSVEATDFERLFWGN